MANDVRSRANLLMNQPAAIVKLVEVLFKLNDVNKRERWGEIFLDMMEVRSRDGDLWQRLLNLEN